MPSFVDAIRDLAAAVGGGAAQAVSDEHARWEIYQRALVERLHDAMTLRALREDPDPVLVSATVVRALEVVPADDQAEWLDVLSPGPDRDFAERRAAEMELLRHLMHTTVDFDIDAADVRSWSNWLQRQAVEQVSSQRVLDLLATDGNTKRIRSRARERRGSP